MWRLIIRMGQRRATCCEVGKAMMRIAAMLWVMGLGVAQAETTRSVYLEDRAGEQTLIATLMLRGDGSYEVSMNAPAFGEHFLSMRPFKCLEGPSKHWCHVPYPYDIKRNISEDLVDLEYDFLFIWKGSAEYGINMWNGIYYKIAEHDGALIGVLHEMDMDLLSAPPEPGELRPLRAQDVIESDPDSHWLPKLVIR